MPGESTKFEYLFESTGGHPRLDVETGFRR
jgi:hypothetical protein